MNKTKVRNRVALHNRLQFMEEGISVPLLSQIYWIQNEESRKLLASKGTRYPIKLISVFTI